MRTTQQESREKPLVKVVDSLFDRKESKGARTTETTSSSVAVSRIIVEYTAHNFPFHYIEIIFNEILCVYE